LIDIVGSKKVIAQLSRNAGFSHFYSRKIGGKLENDDFWGQKSPKLGWRQPIFLELSRLSNYQKN
jgi:hypothetical protein